MTTEQDTSALRPPGRPRSREVDEAILSASIDLLIERGIGWTSIEQIARRARVTRATVYRRFPNLTELLVRAVEWEYRHVMVDPDDPGGLSGWADIDAMITDWADQLSDARGRRLIRRLYSTLDDLPELLHAYNNAHGSRQSHAVRTTLERAHAAGQFPPHSDSEVLQQVLSGAALQHLAAYPDDSSAADIRAYFLAVLQQSGLTAAAITTPRSGEQRA